MEVSSAILSRTWQAVLLLFLVSLVTFVLVRLAPGDPSAFFYGSSISAEDAAQFRARWGLDDPVHIQYVRWAANALSGDLGRSYQDGRPVLTVIAERVPASLLLAISALVMATVLGVSLGVLAASRYYSMWDRAITLVATLCYSTPAFWLGIVLILLFSVRLGWLPSGGIRNPAAASDWTDLLRHLTLPAAALAVRDVGRIARVTRSSMLEVLSQDYLRTATAKGLGPRTITLRHTLRNALLPVITLLGMAIPGLLSGSVIIETVFGWPGMGRLAIESALQRNYPVIMGEVLIVAAMAIAGSLLADITCSLADPRLGRTGRG
ncbi:MAG TPA: ABC transporter permease [Chloroflexota bacterium]|nr:ABC transporter permease [Chloroflexota bacterium]